MKKHRIITLSFIFLITGQSLFGGETELKTNLVIMPKNYYIPQIERIENTTRPTAALYLKAFSFQEKRTSQLKINVKMDNLFTTELGFWNKHRIDTFSYFPFRAYFTLLEKKNFYSDTIAIPINNLKIVPSDKKSKVVVIFKGPDDIRPEEDMECYAVVYLNKRKIGITEQKLLSQPKLFEFEVTFERHLLQLEVFIQDPFKKAWTRLKNIDQPMPKYFLPSETGETLYLVVIYNPKSKGDKYQFLGSFIK